MSKREHTVEIEGYRSVTFKALSSKQLRRVFDQAPAVGAGVEAPVEKVQLLLVLRRSLIEPKFDEFMADAERLLPELPDLIDEVATAVIHSSGPEGGI